MWQEHVILNLITKSDWHVSMLAWPEGHYYTLLLNWISVYVHVAVTIKFKFYKTLNVPATKFNMAPVKTTVTVSV